MENEWKKLQVDNLPPDILTGDYEFQYDSDFWTDSDEGILEILRKVQLPSFYYRYRKAEPKAPTHEEIMTKWWEHDNGVWFGVLEYDSKTGEYLCNYENCDWVDKSYFTGRKSADIPPEKI